jgi:hypothetical protein
MPFSTTSALCRAGTSLWLATLIYSNAMHDSAPFTRTISALGTLALLGLVAACGAKIPEHDGYRTAKAEVWATPQKIELDDDFEAEVDSELSYPKRQRARWLVLNLPRAGEIDLSLTYAPLGEVVNELDEDDPFDVGFEVYDDHFRVLTRADRSEDDAGERKKRRTLYELPRGKYYIHVFLQRRLDEVEYSLRLQLRPAEVDIASTDFPKMVAFLDPLPAVPEVDDAPRPEPCRGRKCGGNGKKPPKPESDRTEPEPQPAGGSEVVAVPSGGLRARITGVRAAGGGTRITINRGTAHGVAKGWRGRIVTKDSKSIPNGSFVLDTVKAQESEATVQTTPDAATSAAHAIIQP